MDLTTYENISKTESSEVEIDESYFGGRRKGKRGRGAAGKVPVFGILERDGRVWAQVLPNVKARTVMRLTVTKVRSGSIVYTDKYQIYDALMFCGYRHLKIDHGRRCLSYRWKGREDSKEIPK